MNIHMLQPGPYFSGDHYLSLSCLLHLQLDRGKRAYVHMLHAAIDAVKDQRVYTGKDRQKMRKKVRNCQ